jgi:phosphomannomutase
MTTEFVFDVDGTLTPSRGKIDPEFKQFFDEFCRKNNVYFVTGSDKDKTVEQLGEDTYALAKVVFNCSGNDIYTTGVNVRKSEWTLPDQLRKMLEGWLQGSNFKYRTGNHIEERPGTVNFSIVGRNCTLDERKEYIKYDKLMRERESIAFQINHSFKDITATVGGETGIDIYPTGCDKGQVYYEFSKGATIHFFGDKMEPGGNDYPLAKLLKHPSKATQVNNWQHTWELLKKL